MVNTKHIAVLCACTLISACASDRVTKSATTFGTQATQASGAYEKLLDEYYAQRLKDERAGILKERIEFTLAPDCGVALADMTIASSACKITPVREPSNLGTKLKSDNLRALAKALASYGTALATLAGDFKDEDEALLESYTKAGAAFLDLDKAVADAKGKDGSIEADKLNSAVAILADISSATFQFKRERELLDLIETSNDAVGDAVALLSESMRRIRGERASSSLKALNKAFDDYDDATKTNKNLSKPLSDLEKALVEHRTEINLGDPFAKLGEAHNTLANAAKSGMTRRDYVVVLERLVAIAKDIDAFSDI
ncbi:MAG: hypothetical protein AAF092_15665 [Pseudomonadota bacterium]